MNIHLVDMNECDSNPCQNGATCEDIIAGFVCTCPPYHSGTFCENGETFTTLCHVPYYGKQFQLKII